MSRGKIDHKERSGCLQYHCSVLLMLVFLTGCTVLKLPFEVVKTAGTVVGTTGKVACAAGSGVVTTAQVVGKFVDVGGKVVDAVVRTPGATELLVTKIKP